MSIHVLGSKGWIGSQLVRYLSNLGHDVHSIHRENMMDWLLNKNSKDLVIYTIGITGDFRSRPYETYQSNAGLLNKILSTQQDNIKKFLYLSSSRVYMRNQSTLENEPIKCISNEPSDLYNISKLMGESIVLSNKNDNYKVVRISNVVGADQPNETFIGQLINEFRTKGESKILQSPNSEKDYISMKDVIYYIRKIALNSNNRIYNIASGYNTTHMEVANWLNSKGYKITFESLNNEVFKNEPINISRLLKEYRKPGNPFIN